MRFSELMRVQRDDLIVSPMHDEWLANNANPYYSAEAMSFMNKELKKQGRKRKGTISASSLDSCRRRQEFTWLGWWELPPSPKTAQIFHNGNFMHLRWQMAGITAGWLKHAEVAVPHHELKVSGTMDGVLYEGSVLELKSINTNGFSRVSTFGPEKQHQIQVGTYMYLTGADKGSIIYEDKNTQEYREFIVLMTQDLEDLVRESATTVWKLIDAEELAPPLTDCEAHLGYRYQTCPYRDRCLGVKTWKEAKALTSITNP
jgi:hypothetical protein